MDIKKTVFTALFTALIAAGAFIIIPAGPVPVSLQTLFIILAGMLGGRNIGVSSSLLYLVLGALGLPVFSGGTGGIAHLLGPTGGYLAAAVPAAYIAGVFSDLGRRSRCTAPPWVLYTAAAVSASLVFYAMGIPWLKFVLGLSWGSALAAGLVPFIIGDVLKAAAAVIITGKFRSRIDDVLYQGTQE